MAERGVNQSKIGKENKTQSHAVKNRKHNEHVCSANGKDTNRRCRKGNILYISIKQ